VEANADPRARAGAALKLVQERIAYLAEGMNGGNYVPQTPEKTWETRYGDCKAKTLLLAAMLREMGLHAEPVLVNAVRGDAVVDDLPMPGAFNHVLVRAVVDGEDLWLDGTTLGTGIGSLGDVPPFAWGLPLRPDGADLLKLPNRAPALASVSIVNRIDMSAGVDFPVLYDLKVDVTGQMGALLQQISRLPDNEQRRELIDGMVGSFMGQTEVIERTLVFDQATGVSTITAKGMSGTSFNLKDKRAEYVPNLFANGLSFEANRSKASWRDIPIALPNADRRKTDITVALPPLEGYTLKGGDVHAEAAGAKVDREAQLVGSTLHIVEEVATTGGELAPADIGRERAAFAALTANPLRLLAPTDAPRAWNAKAINPARLQAIETAYSKLIADHPDESGYYFGRASFFSGMRDHKRALADLDKAVALDESAYNLAARAEAKQALGDFVGAAADLAKATELDPGGGRVAQQALVMGLAGQSRAALPLVEQAIADGGDDRPFLVQAKAELLARLDRGEEGAAALSELAADRPGDATLLNAQCWFSGVWQIELENAARDCEAAVIAGDYAPAVLDCRALANLRLGKLDAALADANAVLGRNPGQEQTLLLRGVIRTRLGDRAGATDIAEALRRRPGLKAEYEGYGLLPAK
jgi:tetratricopeptide (TPR) repeat protein